MTKTRRTFTDEFKREAVALLESSGRPLMQVAAELGIQPSQLRHWQKLIHGPGSRPTTPLAGTMLAPPLRRPAGRRQPTWPPRTPGCSVSWSVHAPSGTF